MFQGSAEGRSPCRDGEEMERPENKENWGSGQHRSQADGPSQEGGRSAVSAAAEGSGRIGSKWNRWPCREGHRRCQLSDEEH